MGDLRSFFHRLRPLLLIGYSLCVIPYSLQARFLTPPQKFLQAFQFIVALSLVTVVVYSSVVLQTNNHEHFASNPPAFIKLFHFFENMLDIVLLVIVCIGGHFKRGKFVLLLDKFAAVVNQFGNVTDDVLNSLRKHTIILIGAIFTVEVFEMIIFFILVKSIEFVPLVVKVHVPLLISTEFIHLYGFVVCVIWKLIGEINRKLEGQVNNHSTELIKPIKGSVSDKSIFKIRIQHLQLADFLYQLNNGLGMLLISNLCSSFANLNVHCLYLYTFISTSTQYKNITHIIAGITIVMVLRIWKVLVIIIPNSLVKAENYKTVQILCTFPEADRENFNSVSGLFSN